jgi:hypothetical protein
MRRKFSPVLISDPVSENHLVKLRPNQSFVLRLSDSMGVTEVDSESHFFRLSDVTRKGEHQFFHFSQTAELFDWSLLSSVHLGDVVILLPDYRLVNLCIILESSNSLKKDVISCINPEGWHIKVLPHQVIELVLFDALCKEEWTCEVHEGQDKQIKFEQICSQVIERSSEPLMIDEYDKRINDVFFPFARSRSPQILEQHFWFRCDAKTVANLYSTEDGNYHAGTIVATPSSGKNMLKTLNINLGVKAKRKSSMHKARLLPARRDNKSNLPVVAYKPRYKFYGGHQQSEYDKKDWWKGKESYQHTYTPRTEIQEVEIKEKKFGSLEDGCKVESLKSVAKNISTSKSVCHHYEGAYCA